MTAYHGTLAGEEILNTGFLLPTNKENSVYGVNEEKDGVLNLQTSQGYVYLALEEEKACEFAFGAMVHKGKALIGATIYIFEVDANGLQLYPDYDEVGNGNIDLYDAIEESKTFAVMQSLKLGERVKRYKEIKVRNSQELSDIIDSGKLSSHEWIELV